MFLTFVFLSETSHVIFVINSVSYCFYRLQKKTVIFLANVGNRQYSKERSGASEKTARENGENAQRPFFQ